MYVSNAMFVRSGFYTMKTIENKSWLKFLGKYLRRRELKIQFYKENYNCQDQLKKYQAHESH